MARAKLAAALIPLGVLVVPTAVLGRVRPWAAVAATLGVAASTWSNALIQLWYEKPIPRRAFRRPATGSALTTLGGLLAAAGWGAAAAIATSGFKPSLLTTNV